MRVIHKSNFEDRPYVLKTSLMFVEDNKICDGCDRHGVRCASIKLLKGDVSILCQDRIEGILDSLDPGRVRDIKIDKILE